MESFRWRSFGPCPGFFKSLTSIVVPASKDPNLVFLHFMHKAVLLIDASGPTATQFVLQGFTNQARSSKAAASNSKLLNGHLEGETLPALFRLQETTLHRFGLEQVCGFPLRFNFSPEVDRNDDCSRFAVFVGDDLDLRVCHNLSVLPQSLDHDWRDLMEPDRTIVVRPLYEKLRNE